MLELKAKVVAAGFSQEVVDKMDEKQLRKVASALKLELPPAAHTVEIVEYKGRKYVKTSGFPVPAPNKGDPKTAQGLFMRVEAVDQAIADLLAAKELQKK